MANNKKSDYTVQRVNSDRSRFIPEDEDRAIYDSMDYHRKAQTPKKKKGLWCIEREYEFEIFQKAELGNWICQSGDLWSIGKDSKGSEVLGTEDEKLAQFKPPTSNGQGWHGYPFKKSTDKPPNEVIKKWADRKVITRCLKNRLYRGDV